MTHPLGPIVIGVGSPMRSDDSVGHVVAERLLARGGLDGACEVVAIDAEPTRLLEVLRSRPMAVIVDAMVSGAHPGTIARFEVGTDRLPSGTRAVSSHGAGLTDAIELAVALDALPDTVVVYGVELACSSFGTELSSAVEAAVERLVPRIEYMFQRPRRL